MNIFNALTLGNVGIREPNITAVLGYLLTSSRNHSMDDALLLELIKIINRNNDERIINLEEYISSEINIEHRYKDKIKIEGDEVNRTRALDIQIKLINSEDKIFHRIIIENKIKDGHDETQLEQEYWLEREEKNNSKGYYTDDASITVLFITHSKCSINLERFFKELEMDYGDVKMHIYWSSDEEGEKNNTIYNAILEVIKKDQLAKINPIHVCALHTIKSFARHIKSIGSSNDQKSKKSRNCKEWRDFQDRYDVVNRMKGLKEKLSNSNTFDGNCVFSDLDTQRDCSRTSFYCNINTNENFRICIQARNKSDMKIRVLIRPVPQPENIHPNKTDKKKLKDFCDEIPGLECINEGAYAKITEDDNINIYEGDDNVLEQIETRVKNLINFF